MSFVPMYFGCMYRIIFKADCCKSFHLSPTASPKSLTQSREVSNGASSCNRFNVHDFPDYFKIHRVFIKSFSAEKLKQPSNGPRVYSFSKIKSKGCQCKSWLRCIPPARALRARVH